MKSGNNPLVNDESFCLLVIDAGEIFLYIMIDVLIVIRVTINTIAIKVKLQFDIVDSKATTAHLKCSFPESIKILGMKDRGKNQEDQDGKTCFHEKKLIPFM